MADIHVPKRPSSRLKGWGALLISLFLLWVFTFYAVPWVQVNVPGMPTLTRAIKDRDIDTTAFFYSENKESYEAERYLQDTLGLSHPDGYDGFDARFMLGIFLCVAILAVGFRLMSSGTDKKLDDRGEASHQQ